MSQAELCWGKGISIGTFGCWGWKLRAEGDQTGEEKSFGILPLKAASARQKEEGGEATP